MTYNQLSKIIYTNDRVLAYFDDNNSRTLLHLEGKNSTDLQLSYKKYMQEYKKFLKNPSSPIFYYNLGRFDVENISVHCGTLYITCRDKGNGGVVYGI